MASLRLPWRPSPHHLVIIPPFCPLPVLLVTYYPPIPCPIKPDPPQFEYRADQPHLTLLHDPYFHLVYAATGADVQTVLVNGRGVVQDRRLLSFDLAETLARAPEIGQRLVGQKGRQPDVPFGIRRPIPGPPAACMFLLSHPPGTKVQKRH